jgi:hypothetical protein
VCVCVCGYWLVVFNYYVVSNMFVGFKYRLFL